MSNATVVAAVIRADGSAVLHIDGRAESISTTRPEDARREIVRRLTARAAELSAPVPVTVTEPDVAVQLVVTPDGGVNVVEDTDVAPTAPQPNHQGTVEQAPAAAPAQSIPRVAPQHSAPQSAPPQSAPPEAAPSRATPAQSVAPHVAPERARRSQTRQSFLKHEEVERPASKGWRGALVRVGLRVPPNAKERAERADLHAVAQHWAGPRTIAVVNGKGGAGKTPTTINLAAVFARNGGAGVLAWDNNQTRGTLGWRTEQGPHDATLLELLPRTGLLLGASAQSADLARFVHHQTADKFDVLRSKPAVLASEQRITAQDVSSIHAVAAKYYRLIVIDSGNDETDPLWLQMIDHTDQLVVATTTRDDHAEAGALLLEGLAERDERSARLAANAVAVVTQADPKATGADIHHVAEGFRSIARDVVSIPFDAALVDSVITFDALRPETRRAWLGAAAAIARGL